MPWWSLVYLLIFALLSIAGIAEQFRTKQTTHALATIVSATFFCLFVVACFYQPAEQAIGIFIIPMLVYVGLYDWWLSDLDLQSGSENFFKPLPDVKSKLSDTGALLILLPGYLAGLTVAYRVVMNA